MPRESLEEITTAYQESNPTLAVLLYITHPFSPEDSKIIFLEPDKLTRSILKDKPIRVYFYDKERLVRIKRVGGMEGVYKDYYFFRDDLYKEFKKATLTEKVEVVCPCGKTVF